MHPSYSPRTHNLRLHLRVQVHGTENDIELAIITTGEDGERVVTVGGKDLADATGLATVSPEGTIDVLRECAHWTLWPRIKQAIEHPESALRWAQIVTCEERCRICNGKLTNPKASERGHHAGCLN